MGLGEFEYVLITAAAGLSESACGAAIREEIEKVAHAQRSNLSGKKAAA